MSRYWRIGTVSQRSDTDHWPEMRDGGFVAIGWNELGDLSDVSPGSGGRRQILSRITAANPDMTARQASNEAHQVHDFVRTIQRGDVVAASDGLRVKGVGTVEGPYQHAPRSDWPHRRHVRWLETTEWSLSKDGAALNYSVHELLRRALNDVRLRSDALRPSQRGYWAVFANPRKYRIDQAVATLDEGTWTTKNRSMRPGDRLLVWRGLGLDGHRGIVAFAEVLSDPVDVADAEDRHWIDMESARRSEPRVRIRYLRLPHGPIWRGEGRDDVLDRLTVSRARGGTVFRVEPSLFDAVVALAGGWPVTEPDMALAHEAISVVSGKRGARQGFQTDIARRRAVEKRAIAEATLYFTGLGWRVDDVSPHRPFDLSCTRHGEAMHVEAKGTTTAGEKIVLTHGEVEHNRSCGHDCLYILRDVVITEEDGEVSASGGVPVIKDPWHVSEDRLKPIAYEYTV